MRRAARTDGNHSDIARAWRGVGLSVQSLAAIGRGVPDLLGGGSLPCPHCLRKFPQNILAEVKDGSLSPSRRRLTEDEQNFHALWRGPIVVVNSIDEALRVVGAIK